MEVLVFLKGLSTLIGGVAFGEHGLEDLLFWGSRDDAGYVGLDDDFVLLVLENGFGFGAVAVVEFGDGEAAFDGIAEIDWLFEAKIHFRGEPADLSADFGEHACDEEAVADAGAKILCRGEAVVEMDGVVVPADFGHSHRVLFGERAGDGEGVA